jgi:hypothetical protein
MSWALVGLTTGDAGVGRGGPGTGDRLSAPPDEGRRGGAGLALGPPDAGRGDAGAGAAGAADAVGGAAATVAVPPDSNVARSRRATGASTVLDADFTYSPSSCSLASTVLLSTPSSFASSCTRALPATTLLTSRLSRQCPRSLSRALEAWSLQGLHRVLMSVVLPCGPGGARCSHHRRFRLAAAAPRPPDRCRGHRRRVVPARRRADAPQARGKPDQDAGALPDPAVCVPDQARR